MLWFLWERDSANLGRIQKNHLLWRDDKNVDFARRFLFGEFRLDNFKFFFNHGTFSCIFHHFWSCLIFDFGGCYFVSNYRSIASRKYFDIVFPPENDALRSLNKQKSDWLTFMLLYISEHTRCLCINYEFLALKSPLNWRTCPKFLRRNHVTRAFKSPA